MFTVTVMYSQPKDAAAFERHYQEKHVPLAAKIPNLKRIESSRVVGTPDGSPAPYVRTATLFFDNKDTAMSALSSPDGRAAVQDAQELGTGGVTILFGDTDVITL